MSLNGAQKNILGLARILIKIGDFQIHHSFYILKTSLHPLTLGRDFIDDKVVLLDTIANCLVLRKIFCCKTPCRGQLSNDKPLNMKFIERKPGIEMAEKLPSATTPLFKVVFANLPTAC